jgi:hypothetical protein
MDLLAELEGFYNGIQYFWLKGRKVDTVHAVFCTAGYNLGWLLRVIARLSLTAAFLWLHCLAALFAIRCPNHHWSIEVASNYRSTGLMSSEDCGPSTENPQTQPERR